jgi:HlyD family secretion protein
MEIVQDQHGAQRIGSALPQSSAALIPTSAPVPATVGPQRHARRRTARWVLIAVLILAGGLVIRWWVGMGPVAAPYKTVPVDRGPIAAGVTATGTVSPLISVLVGSQVSGIVEELLADFNSTVTKGQLIARIDPQPFQARVDQARASLRTARGSLERATAQLEQKRLDYARALELGRQEFVSRAEVDTARISQRDAGAAVDVARGQVAQAEAALASALLDLSHTKIYSPVDGIVVSRNVDVGQTVVASLQAPTLFVIAEDLTHMQVDANVSESDIGGVREGGQASFTVDAFPARRFQGTVTQVRNAPISVQNVVTYDVVIGVDNRDLALKPGMTANVSIQTGSKASVLRVPGAALRFRPAGLAPDRSRSVAWVLRDGRLQGVPVVTGLSDGTLTEIVEGDLHEDDRVIVGFESGEGGEPGALPPGFGVGPKVR